MVQGDKKSEILRLEDIYRLTNGGHDIFMYYLGKVGRSMRRPWDKPEEHPSWGVFPIKGIWYWKDHATEETGTAIQFVQRKFHLDFAEARRKILWDFGLSSIQGKVNTSPVVVTWDTPYLDKEYARINFTDKPFEKKHHEFWNIAEVSEDHCRTKNCFAARDLAINGKRINFRPDEIVFVFYAPEEDAAKVYFPERQRESRFRNNVSYHYLWNFENLTDCEDLIIQKSPKDMIVTTMITPCVTSTQAEAIKIFDEDTVNRINSISKRPWVWYGSDDDGVKKCKEITGCNKWRYINTPKNLLPDVNDTYGFVKYHNLLQPGTGLKKCEEFMRSKKLIK